MLKIIALGLALLSSAIPASESPLVVGKARFTVLSDECIRLEYDEKGRFIDEPTLFALKRNPVRAAILQSSGGVQIETSQFALTYRPDGRPFHSGNLSVRTKATAETWWPGKVDPKNLGGTITSLDGVEGPVDLGTGLVSPSGWGFVDDTNQPLMTKDWIRARNSAEFDWYLFAYGRDYKKALRALTTISGQVPLPRKAIFGSWYSRYWPYSSADYRQIVGEYEANDFPLDIMVMDMDWHQGGWTGWTWNEKLIPNGNDLLSWFHKNGLQVTLNVHPHEGVKTTEQSYSAFMKEMGEDPTKGKVLPFDAGNQKYLDTLFKHTHVPLEASGVDFWWLDWQQSLNTPSIPTLKNLAWLNQQYFKRSQNEGLRGLSFSRWGGWGDQRHPIHFSGDTRTTWPGLQFEIAANTTGANVGLFFWSHDIGGHWGVRNDEMMTRWVQFGATSTAMRLHSTRSADLDRRPWTYSPKAREAMRNAFRLRSRLIPYLYSSAYESHRDSVPFNRSLYFEYPSLPAAYQNPQEYLVGSFLLAAPIASAGIGPNSLSTQTLWFPPGDWYDWFSGEKFKGEQESLVTADLDTFPLYAKGGVPIPLQPYQSRMTSAPLRQLIVRAFPGPLNTRSHFDLYEDDGQTDAYLSGASATTRLRYERSRAGIFITVEPTVGSYEGQEPERSYRFELPATSRATAVYVDGVFHPWTYSGAAHANVVVTGPRSIRRGIQVRVVAEDADARALKRSSLARKVHKLLGTPWPNGFTFSELVNDYVRQHGMSDTARALITLSGVGLTLRPDSPYFFPESKKSLKVFAQGAWLGAQPNEIRLEREQSGSKTVLWQASCRKPSGVCRYPIFDQASQLGSSLWASLRFPVGGLEVEEKIEIQGKRDVLNRWKAVGPFAYHLDKSLAGQKFPPETTTPDPSQTFSTTLGTSGWKPALMDKDGKVDYGAMYKMDDQLAYAVTSLESLEEQTVRFRINSDDGIEMWLDGKKIHSKDVLRPIDTEPDVVPATLSPGKHVLLIKVSNHDGGWLSRVALDAAKPLQESSL